MLDLPYDELFSWDTGIGETDVIRTFMPTGKSRQYEVFQITNDMYKAWLGISHFETFGA